MKETQLAFMVERIPELSIREKKLQIRIVSTIFRYACGLGLKHKFDDSKYFLSSNYIKKHLGDTVFRTINDKYKLFEFSEEYCFVDNIGKTCTPTENARLLVDEYCKVAENATPCYLINSEGKRLHKSGKSIASKLTNSELTAKIKADINPLVKIDVIELKRLIDEITDKSYKSPRDYRILYSASCTFDQANNISFPNQLRLCYTQDKHGRLQGVGLHLQNCPKEVRSAALKGRYDYDIENCHFSLFQNFARIYGLKSDSIDYYILNKKEMRKELALKFGPTGDLDKDIATIKKCLLALVYGATLKVKDTNTITKELGEFAEDFCEHLEVKGLYKEIQTIGQRIVEEKTTQKNYVKNDLGLSIWNNGHMSKLIAHCMQGAEAKALKVAIEMYPEKIVLLIHDGFVTNEPIDIKALEQAVKIEMGMDISYSMNVL